MQKPGTNVKALVSSALLAGAVYLAPHMQMSQRGLDDLKKHEGLSLVPYKDQAGVLTVCYGDTKDVHPHRVYSMKECNTRLKEAVEAHTAPIGKYVAVPLTQGQYDALGDFIYQFGEAKFRDSTLLKRLNRWDCWGATEAFMDWVNVNGAPNRGVAVRRIHNVRLFAQGCAVWEQYGLGPALNTEGTIE